ncbi:MAG: sigma-54-dependent transcriptional regulator [Calditrichaceae bacterium]
MAKVLTVDNEERMCKLIKAEFELNDHDVDMAFSGKNALDLIQQKTYDIVVTDLKMNDVDGMAVLEFTKKHSPGTEVILITAFATQETALDAMKKGAYDYLIKPFKMDELSLRVNRILNQKNLEDENKRLKNLASLPDSFPGIIGKSKKMREVFRLIGQVDDSETAVLIRGESGTGKELVAQAIHAGSRRRDATFIALNCAALPETLLESELFGYEKGAFTGADQRKPGQLELANGGTLFLDEIGDLAIGLQAKILRVLQNREVTRLGGREKINIDVRLITATHRNLEEMIADKQFRSDLYYRINIFPINLPALRNRKEDIPELLEYFLRAYPDKSVSQDAKRKLIEYDYPGNVRELENIITRAALISDSVITSADLQELSNNSANPEMKTLNIPDEGFSLDDFEKKLITGALEKCAGNKSHAAKILGITRRRLYSMMDRLGIDSLK